MPNVSRKKNKFFTLIKLFFILPLIISGFLFLLSNQPLSQIKAAGTTYYVSKTGNNSNGASWDTAWNELDQINWSVIQPGDTILLDGGSTECSFPTIVTNTSNTPSPSNCGMVYQSTLDIGKSGTSSNPITIKLASETGRNGTIRIFGGRSVSLPYCNQSGYTGEFGLDTKSLVNFAGKSWFVFDGLKWGGIKIYGGNRHGIAMNGSNNTVRNVEIYDNGKIMGDSGSATPDQEGVSLNGTNNTFERAIIHDNGQDAFQSSGYITNFSLKQSWLYNSRKLPTNPDRPFNHCRHTDGIQIYKGELLSSGILIEDSIIGPGFMQGVLLGGGGEPEKPWAVIDDVIIRNSLFFKSSNGNILSHTNITKPKNWRIENVTSFRKPEVKWSNIQIDGGSDHVIKDSVFYGGYSLSAKTGIVAQQGNCRWQLNRGNTSVPEVNPQFASVNEDDWFSLDDFTVQNSACKGSSITSVAQLLGQPTPTSGPTATPTPTPTPPTNCPPLGDIDCSGKVNGLDFAYLVAHWGTSDPEANLDDLGVIDSLDALILLGNYGKKNED